VELEGYRHCFVSSVYGVRHWGGSSKLEGIKLELRLCYVLMVLFDWEKTNILSVKEMLAASNEVSLVANTEVKGAKIHKSVR